MLWLVVVLEQSLVKLAQKHLKLKLTGYKSPNELRRNPFTKRPEDSHGINGPENPPSKLQETIFGLCFVNSPLKAPKCAQSFAMGSFILCSLRYQMLCLRLKKQLF